MDLAIVELASGDAPAALKTLRESRDELDEQLKLTKMTGSLASMVTDDRSRPYEPAGYEQVLVRSLLSLCSLATGDGDAESYANQAQLKQTELARAAEERGLQLVEETYQPLALATLCPRCVLREASHHDYDDALRSYQLVSHIQPSFARQAWTSSAAVAVCTANQAMVCCMSSLAWVADRSWNRSKRPRQPPRCKSPLRLIRWPKTSG